MNSDISQETPILVLPPLFSIADRRSVAAQGRHFGLIVSEYLILIATAFVTLLAGLNWMDIPTMAYMSCFVILVVIATLSHFAGQDKSWFKSRAIAESVKTMSWRYAMRAPPFRKENADEVFIRKTQRLAKIDRTVFDKISANTESEITPEMKALRETDLESRASVYKEARLLDQFEWYGRKSRVNARKARNWYFGACAVYLIPLALIPANVFDVGQYWPVVSLLLLIGSSLLGWTKAKRFRELASSYRQTADEISSILEEVGTIETEQDLVDLVLATESTFSQEHIGWIISSR